MAIPLSDFLPSGRIEGSRVGGGVVGGVDDAWSWTGFAGERADMGCQPGSDGRSVGQEMFGFPGVGSMAEEVASWVMAGGLEEGSVGDRD